MRLEDFEKRFRVDWSKRALRACPADLATISVGDWARVWAPGRGRGLRLWKISDGGSWSSKIVDIDDDSGRRLLVVEDFHRRGTVWCAGVRWTEALGYVGIFLCAGNGK